jgi:predicted molibdopterin-dependent oxidoreductase YjgC
MDLRIPGVARPDAVTITVRGEALRAHPGESLAAALIAAGLWCFGEGDDPARPRTAFCMMGVCQQCLLRVDGRLVQACLTPVVAGQVVTPA